jgi:hypothetical protein
MANCLVYYDKSRATSWVGDAAGEVLAGELKRMDFNIVNAVELRQRLEDAVRKNEAEKYVVVFARDVIPHDVFDIVDENNPLIETIISNMRFRVPNIVKSPGGSSLMKFIYNGGVVVWLGDIPFWYVTNPKDGMDKLDLWFHAVNPFTILGTIQIFTYPISSPQPAMSILEDLELGVYPSHRPVLYSQDHVKDVKNVGDVKGIRGKCSGELIPLAKTIVVAGVLNPWRILLPNGQVVDMFEVLNRVTKVTTVESVTRGGKVEFGIPVISGTIGREKAEQIITETTPSRVPIYFETYSSWIKCMGKGLFIRLWDYEIRLDKDGNATVTEEEVRGMARKIRDLLEKLGIKCEDKPQHSTNRV